MIPSVPPRIKICGITRLEDALEAARLGADFLGFNFYPHSPRCIPEEECAGIIDSIRNKGVQAAAVGVFVNHPSDTILRIMKSCRLDLAQLSGDETTADLRALTESGIHAFKVLRSPLNKVNAEAFAAAAAGTPALLVDGSAPGLYGGSGKTADWKEAAMIAKRHRVFLAGGLHPDNVAEAVGKVSPWGIDAASGVEASPGRKDSAKMEAFIRAARRAAILHECRIENASPDDAEKILTLQKLAYHSEAELCGDFSIPPMTQTLPEFISEFERMTILKAVSGGRIVGSVRADFIEGTCRIGRLIVHPEFQNLGIGGWILHELEARFREAKRYELFTSEHSKRNLYLYQKLGYRIFRRERLNENVLLVYLEKPGSTTS